MKRGEMQKIIFRFLDRLQYFPYYRTIVLNVKVKKSVFFMSSNLQIVRAGGADIWHTCSLTVSARHGLG